MKQTKAQLRERFTKIRDSLTESYIKEASLGIFKKISEQPFFKQIDKIMCYVSFRNEVYSHDFIREMLKQNKTVCVPVVLDKKTLGASVLKNFGELKAGTFGILEPDRKKSREIEIEEIELAIIPGLAFDKNLHRLGFGAGYYDRFLPKTSAECIKLGVAFENQIVDKLPVEKHDIPMDMVFTEKHIYKLI